jgi:hypothetical protein
LVDSEKLKTTSAHCPIFIGSDQTTFVLEPAPTPWLRPPFSSTVRAYDICVPTIRGVSEIVLPSNEHGAFDTPFPLPGGFGAWS